MNKKKVIILISIILLVAIVATCLTIYFMRRAKYVYDIVEVSSIEYNTVRTDNRYGVIDRNGNIMVI